MLMPLVSLEQGNVKKSKKLMKRVNIEEEAHHIFRKNVTLLILIVTKEQGYIHSLKNSFLKKP